MIRKIKEPEKLTVSFIEFSDWIYEKKISVAATGLSYRAINNWEYEGLIDSDREYVAQWRKFSFIDYLWLKVISELRGYGFPSALLKKVKERMFENDTVGMTLLNKYIYSNTDKDNYVFIINNEGSVIFQPVRASKIPVCQENFICLNLGLFIRSSFKKFSENHSAINIPPRKTKPFNTHVQPDVGEVRKASQKN